MAFFADNDGDGFGNPEDAITDCEQPNGYVSNDADCDDSDPAVYPGAEELCNNKDDNCDGQIDEGLATDSYYLDNDGDGFGNAEMSITTCAPPSGYVANNEDCDDSDPTINPDASEIANNGIDEDCDGMDFVSSTENSVEESLLIHPNPAMDKVYIISNAPDVQFALFNSQGKSMRAYSDGGELDVSDYPAGLYFIVIRKGSNKRTSIHKLIISR